MDMGHFFFSFQQFDSSLSLLTFLVEIKIFVRKIYNTKLTTFWQILEENIRNFGYNFQKINKTGENPTKSYQKKYCNVRDF